MPSLIGFDSKETHRDVNGEDRTYPLGASVEIYDNDKFIIAYDKAMEKVWANIGEKRKRKIYPYQYFAQVYGIEDSIEILTPFIKDIKQNIINSDVYFTNIPDEKIPQIFMYNNDGKKAIKSTKDFLTSLVQPYPYICAWKRCQGEEGAKGSIFLLDHFQGETTIAWDSFWYRKPNIFYKGDLCNALISTSDIIAGIIDNSLRDESFSLDSINEILTKMKLNGKSYLIGSKDLRFIVPITRVKINTNRFLKHPIYYIIKEERIKDQEYKEARNQIEYSPMFDHISNFAFKNNGGIKFFDETQDYRNLKIDDSLIYIGERGKDLSKSFVKQGYIDEKQTYYYQYEKEKIK